MSLTNVTLYEQTMGVRVCPSCWSTGVAARIQSEQLFFSRCGACNSAVFTSPALRLSERIFQRAEKCLPVDVRELVMSRALVHATPHVPAPRHLLMSLLGATEREVKDIARTLRREWVLPVGSNRRKPYGYYWISTAEEYLEWSRPYRAQALDELVTEHKLRQLFPELAGQSSFDFVHDLQRQIEEALV
jgi:hypothetical protein